MLNALRDDATLELDAADERADAQRNDDEALDSWSRQYEADKAAAVEELETVGGNFAALSAGAAAFFGCHCHRVSTLDGNAIASADPDCPFHGTRDEYARFLAFRAREREVYANTPTIYDRPLAPAEESAISPNDPFSLFIASVEREAV